MKLTELLIKLAVAAAAVVGIAYLIVRYMDAIKAWAEKLCPCNVEVVEEEEAPVEETPVEETVEEVVAEEVAPVEVPADAPVADAADFEA